MRHKEVLIVVITMSTVRNAQLSFGQRPGWTDSKLIGARLETRCGHALSDP